MLRLAQPLALNAHDAGVALQRLLTDTRCGPVSSIDLPGRCLVRMIRRHDRPSGMECVVTWVPATHDGPAFIGSLSIVKCGRRTLALVLDGMVEVHDRAELQDEALARVRAEAVGRSVLERVAVELTFRNRQRVAQRPINHATPMLQTANARSAKAG